MRFVCRRERSSLGWVRRPRVDVDVYSPRARAWIRLTDVLADTGADLSLVPRSVGIALLGRLRSRRRIRLGGIAPGARVVAYLHPVRLRLGRVVRRAWLAVASVEHVPAILGRQRGLDFFAARFVRGRYVDLR